MFKTFCVAVVMLFGFVVNGLQISSKLPSVWKVFGDIAHATGSTNLGQGFPDWDPPPFVLNSLKRTISHQYTRPAGFVPLVELLAQRYTLHLKQSIDPMTNVAVTVGATQALYLTLSTLVSEGDEVLMFDPYFELYAKQIALTKATAKFVSLGQNVNDPWAVDLNALRKLVFNILLAFASLFLHQFARYFLLIGR
jgi:aspartate/methionine/tyrosine aminotransferase